VTSAPETSERDWRDVPVWVGFLVIVLVLLLQTLRLNQLRDRVDSMRFEVDTCASHARDVRNQQFARWLLTGEQP